MVVKSVEEHFQAQGLHFVDSVEQRGIGQEDVPNSNVIEFQQIGQLVEEDRTRFGDDHLLETNLNQEEI